MPSIAAHFVCAKLVAQELNIDDNYFYQGNILPDIIDNYNSHLKIPGKYYLIPDIDNFKKNYYSKNNLYLGYLCHLLLDKYFLEDYIPKFIKNNYDEIFKDDMIYEDYTNMNIILIETFNLNLDKINNIMESIFIKIDIEKYLKNKSLINNKMTTRTFKILSAKDFILFLKQYAHIISLELEKERRSKENEFNSHMLSFCFKK